MALTPHSSGDFWAEDEGAGTAATWEFEGVEGLRRLTGPQTTTAPEPARFRARLTRVQLDHVALEYYSATPHSSDRGPGEIAEYPTPLLTVMHLLEGSIEVRLSDVSFAVAAGESIVLDSRQPVAVTATSDVRALRSVVGVEHIPAALQRDGASVPGPLPRTALLQSFAAFVGTVLRSSRQHHLPVGPQLIAAMVELQSAVLAQAQQVVEFPVGPAGLRYRIEQHIQQHHTDPSLDVAAIAQAVGISIRHAHGVFNDGDRTIAAVLRERRTSTAALLLRAAGPVINLGHLAHDAGFTDRDVLMRAFKHHYGMTPSEYHEGGHRQLG